MRVLRKAGLIVAGLAAVAASLGVAPAAQASAPVQAPAGSVVEATEAGPLAPFRLKNRATGLCLTNSYSGGHVFTASCDGRRGQDWYWYPTSSTFGYEMLRNLHSLECLDASSGTGRVYSLGCNGGGNQKWDHIPLPAQVQQRSSLQNLDSNHAGSVYLSPGNTGDFQRWDFA